jgi:hypothetical protein
MSKRSADASGGAPLKDRERPEQMDVDMDRDRDMGDFEDEFEDEFESEDEIIEAGVDGRPDAEREAEEKGKISFSLPRHTTPANLEQKPWKLTRAPSSSVAASSSPARRSPPI